MTQKTRAQLLSETNILLASNTQGEITADDLRVVIDDLSDSVFNFLSDSPLPIVNGGTGATTLSGAKANLGIGASGGHADSFFLQTANNLSDVVAATARTNLALGTIATQAASAVSITGGSITGITDLAIADGGTGASTAANARTNLGLGTIATQDASAVAITGGTINNTTIGATIPTTGAFTTLTATTPSTFDNTTKAATTAYYHNNTPPQMYIGLEPQYASATTIDFFGGCIANGSSNPTDYARVVATITVNLANLGANGMDTGAHPPASGTVLYFFLFFDPTGVLPAVIVATIQENYGAVTVPSGYSLSYCRKLDWGAVYTAAGIPSFHYSSRITYFTLIDGSSTWFPSGGSNVDTAGVFTSISLAAFLPKNARLAIVNIRTEYVSAPGSSYIRPGSGAGSSTGIVTGTVSSTATKSNSLQFLVQTSSINEIQIKTDTGVKIWVSVAGYHQTEIA